MKTRFLFPGYFRTIGWFLFIPSLIAGILGYIFNIESHFLNVKVFAIYYSSIFEDTQWFKIITDNIENELIGILLITGASFIAFSKLKNEDEYISKIRLESLLWATYFNYSILILCIIFLYGGGFFVVMVYNIVSTLLFFLIRFYYKLNQLKKEISHEK
jgi:hypothetical protein